ncbi:MAG: CoB--CoM heterodisulfide reductase iron-sulfur subunit A family protein, partial [Thermoplasmata archaeon]
KEPDMATEKAKRLIAMGVAKAALLEPQTEGESEVVPTAVVIGGGAAGLAAASSLVAQGIETHLIEKSSRLGGMLNDISVIGPELEETAPLLDAMLKALKTSRKAHVHTDTRLTAAKGFVGNFELSIDEKGESKNIRAGSIIVATGTRELVPTGEYGHGFMPGVITQLDLERMLAKGEVPKRSVFVLCVGSRQPGREYCSRVCCNVSLKNAMRIVEARPGSTVTILHRDIMSYGTVAEKLYRDVSERGVRFLRYNLANPAKVRRQGMEIVVEVNDETLGEDIELRTDVLVLATPMVSREDATEVGKLLKVPLDKHGFFLEAHVKLRPVEFATDGVFICGSARWPASVRESISQGLAAAAKAAIPIKKGRVVIEAITAWSDPDKCAACGNCVVVCPYEAIEIVDTDKGRIAKVNEAQCKGCGTCVAACPNDAMQQKGFTTRQLGAMIDALVKNALEESP